MLCSIFLLIPVRLKSVTTNTVTIIIESEPIEVTLEIGETKQVDVDGDGVNDISITLNDIVDGLVDLTTKRLTPLPVKEVHAEEVPSEEAPVEEVVPEVGPSKAWLWILITVILAVIITSYFYMQKKKK